MFIEIGVNELNTLYRSTGLVSDQVYRVINSGNLEPNALTVKFGDFVKWDGSKWVMDDTKLATDEDVDNSTKNTLDDKDPADTTIEFKTDAEGAAAYDKGYYFLLDDKIFITDSITNEGAVYTITATKKNGVIPVINSLVARIAALENT